jgi:ArsR family transcriptional regulator, arsenate/arsenite/antimonite-responsive transcriptional repressor
MVFMAPEEPWPRSSVLFSSYVLPLMPATLVTPALFDQVARRFRLLGEPARLQLLNHLHAHGETTVQDLVAATGQSQPNVSKHLRLLRAEGLVDHRRDGAFMYYRIADPTIAALCMLVCGHLRAE